MSTIYLDNNATSKPSDTVVKSMLHYLCDTYYNSSSVYGSLLKADVPRAEAATAMAALLNAEGPECFKFTSGATESNNWVFSSVSQAHKKGKILLSRIEHPSVSEPAISLSHQGFDIVEVPVDRNGTLDLQLLSDGLTDDTVLVSVMAANNETGVIEPLDEIGQIIRSRCPQALFHTDATQAVGKIHLDLQANFQEVDLLSFSAHKFHGPKGIGGLYIREGIRLFPLLRGGGQETGLRAGTTNTPGLAGLAAAASEVDLAEMDRIESLRDFFEGALALAVPSVVFHSGGARRLPNTSCLSVPGQSGDDLAYQLASKGIIVGTGSACSAGANHPPKTLLSMGTDYSIAAGAIRIGMSKYTSSDEVAFTLAAISDMIR